MRPRPRPRPAGGAAAAGVRQGGGRCRWRPGAGTGGAAPGRSAGAGFSGLGLSLGSPGARRHSGPARASLCGATDHLGPGRNRTPARQRAAGRARCRERPWAHAVGGSVAARRLARRSGAPARPARWLVPGARAAARLHTGGFRGRGPVPVFPGGCCMSVARPPEGAHTAAEGEGAPSFAARPPEGAHTVAGGEGAPVRRRRQRFVRLAGAAACATLAAMLAVMLPCPARAQTNGSGATGGARGGGPIVQPPLAFGYQLGDLVTQRLLLPADGRRLETAALPRAERISGWLERRPFQWETDAEGRQWLLVSYQIVNAPQTLSAIALPALSLPMSAGPALQTDAQLISVGPLTPQTVLGKGGLLDIRPDRPASVAPSAPIARRLQRWLLALAGTLA